MILYIVAIGGTGAKCAESLIHVAASGLFKDVQLKFLFVDPDESNGSLTRTKKVLEIYNNCREKTSKISSSNEELDISWMKTPIHNLGHWSPFEAREARSLGACFSYDSYHQKNRDLKYLFDILYKDEDRQLPLEVGFRGRPSIGAALMSRLRYNKYEVWDRFFNEIDKNINGNIPFKVLLCGSIFGGTGASGIPTIGRLIYNKLQREYNNKSPVSLGALLLLPYFYFQPSTKHKSEIYASSNKFLFNTQIALHYYSTQNCFNFTYLLGSPQLNYKQEFSIGQESQQNKSHYIELYAALAAKNFINAERAGSDNVRKEFVYIGRTSEQKIVWKDFPDSIEVKDSLLKTLRFAGIWLAGIDRDLRQINHMSINRFQKLVPWFSEFFRPSQLKFFDLINGGRDLPDIREHEQEDIVNAINEWCTNYLNWITEIQISCGKSNLFKIENQSKRPGEFHINADSLDDLFIESRIKKGEEKSKSIIQDIKEQLISKESLNHKKSSFREKGALGLAQVLYSICSDYS